MDVESRDWLRSLYDENRDIVFRYALTRVGRDDAMDVVSDTFIEAERSRASFDAGRGSERSWLLGIATNRIRRLRRNESREAGTREFGRVDGGDDAELIELPDRVDAERRSGIVSRAIAALPDGERAAILLHAVDGLDTAEVAESLHISKTAAKVRIFRARRRLRESLSHLDISMEAS